MFEQYIQQQMFNNSNIEKSFIDKILAQNNAQNVTQIIQKSPLTREDLNKLATYLVSPELKMLSIDHNERQVILKYYVWVREFMKVGQTFFDYKDKLELQQNFCVTCKKLINHKDKNITCKCIETDNSINTYITEYNRTLYIIKELNKIYEINENINHIKFIKPIKIRKRQIIISDKMKSIYEHVMHISEHCIKSMVDMYFGIIRTSLSIQGTAFDTLTSTRYEMQYATPSEVTTNVEKKKGIFG